MYSYADAARFIGGKARELRRWVSGLEHRHGKGSTGASPGLWKPQLSSTEAEGLGFKDLIELRFVRTFRDEGVSLSVIRRTLDVAREQFAAPYPLTSRRFRTDGKRIFLEVVEESGDESLVDLSRRQNVIRKVIGPSLREGVELDMQGEAVRWYPLRQSKAVVLDPLRHFGEPILSESGIPTIAVADAVTAEDGDEKRVARIFEVSPAAVRKALEFESRTRAA